MLLIAASILIAATTASLDDRVKGEIERLDALLKSKEAVAPKELSDMPKIFRNALDRARQAKTAETRLYRLRGAYPGIESLAFMIEHQDSKKDLASIRKLWDQVQPRFRTTPAARGTFLERALQQAAANRAEILFAASIAYAKIDEPASGLYYIGEAEGNRRYGDFVRSVASASGDQTRVPSEGSLRSAFNEVQDAAIRAFEKDAGANTMLQLNAKLKETRELLDAKRLEAATLLLLESRYELSKRAPDTVAASPSGIPPNDAMTALFTEIAGLETPENARALQNDVLSLYASLPTRKVVTEARVTKPVTVTLIRWPYT